jgi:tape measure domain-containing protein
MNNTIEFVLRMKDMMSSNITRVSSTSQSAFNRMSQSANQMTGRNRVLAMSFTELQNKIRQVEDTISRSTVPSQIAAARRELSALQRMSNNHSGNVNTVANGTSGIGIGGVAIGSMLGGVAMRAGYAIVGAVGSGISTMITASMQKEQSITGLTTFLGKKGATEAYNNIRQDANATPYDVQSLLEVNRSLISAGLNAKDARNDTLNLANAVSAVGGGNDVLSRMAANMQQIKTVGKATAMDIRQFGIAGINIYEMLARSTGKSIAQVKEMDVSYETLQASLAASAGKGGIYEGAMAAQSMNKSGRWNTLKDNVMTGLSDIGDAFSPVIMKFLDLGIKFANNITPMIASAQPYIEAISTGISNTVDMMTNLSNSTGGWSDWLGIAKANASLIWGFIKDTATKAWNLVSSFLEFVKQSEILKDVFRVIGWIMEKAFGLVGWLFDSLIWLWENILKPILSAIDAVYKWIKGKDTITIKASQTVFHKTKPGDNDSPENSPLGSGAAMMASNTASGKSAGDTVSGAGPKTVNINVGKFFDNIQFTTLNAKESAQELENIVMESLARVLYNGSKTV